MDEKTIKKDLVTVPKGIMQNNDPEYVRLVSLISGLWKGLGKLFSKRFIYVRFMKIQTVSGQLNC